MINNSVQSFRVFNIDIRVWSGLTGPVIQSGNTPIMQTAFSIADKGYIFFQYSPSGSQYVIYRYDPLTNNWSTVLSGTFSVGVSLGSITATIGNRAFILAYGGHLLEYNADSVKLFNRSRLIETAYYGFLFPEGNQLHFGTGGEFSVVGITPPADTVTSSNIHNRHWLFSATGDSWLQKENFGGSKRTESVSFIYNNIRYVLGGRLVDSVTKKTKYIFDLWKYVP